MNKTSKKRSRPTSSGNVEGDNTNTSKFENVSGLDKYRISDMEHSEVYYMPSLISKDVADRWFSELLKLDSWYQPKLKMYGREIMQSRKIAAYATDPNLTLKYSGQTVDMKYEYPDVLKEIQSQVEECLGVEFNHVLLNLYEDGSVYIGNHRDNLENKVIASVSVGAPRTFIMTRDKRTKMGQASDTLSTSIPTEPSNRPSSPPIVQKSPKRRKVSKTAQIEDPSAKAGFVERKSWILEPGSLVVMQGETQRYWKHEIPKEPKVKEARISLTFRQLIP